MGDLVLKNMVSAIDGKSNAGLPYGLHLTRVFEWFGVDLDGVESVTAKEFLDVKCLSQSNLKIEKDGSLSVIEVPLPTPPPPISSCPIFVLSDVHIFEFMEELRENHRQLVAGQKQLSAQLADLGNDLKFWKEMVFEYKQGNTPEKDTSGTPSYTMSLINELVRMNRCCGGSSEQKLSTEDTQEDKDAAEDGAGTSLAVDLAALKDKIADKMDTDRDNDEF